MVDEISETADHTIIKTLEKLYKRVIDTDEQKIIGAVNNYK